MKSTALANLHRRLLSAKRGAPEMPKGWISSSLMDRTPSGLAFELSTLRCSTEDATGPAEALVQTCVVAVHGNGFSKEVWRPFTKRLERLLPPVREHNQGSVVVVALDLTGHGDSRKFDSSAAHTMESFGEDVSDLMNFLREKADSNKSGFSPSTEFIGLGHSMGSSSLLWHAVRHPDTLLRKMLLVEPIMAPAGDDTFLVNTQSTNKATMALRRRREFDSSASVVDRFRNRAMFERWTDDALDAFVEGSFQNDPARVSGVVLKCSPEFEADNFRLSKHELWDRVAQAELPHLEVLAGLASDVMPPADSKRVADRIRAANYELLPESTHNLHLERPGLLAARALELFR